MIVIQKQAMRVAEQHVAIGDAEVAALNLMFAMKYRRWCCYTAKRNFSEFVSLLHSDPARFAKALRKGVAVNPRNEAFYSHSSQRTFSFEFDFLPRNPKEHKQ